MTTLFRFSSLCLVLFSLLTFTACQTDPCADIECQNDGICVDGTCECEDFYEGPFCWDETREHFLGDYNGTFSCEGDPSIIALRISKRGFNPRELTCNLGDIVLIDNSKFELPFQQLILGANTYFIEGAGSLSGDQLIMNFTLTIDGSSWNCNYTGTR